LGGRTENPGGSIYAQNGKKKRRRGAAIETEEISERSGASQRDGEIPKGQPEEERRLVSKQRQGKQEIIKQQRRRKKDF